MSLCFSPLGFVICIIYLAEGFFVSANGPNQVLLETISRCPAGNPMQMPPAAVQCGQLKAWGGFVRVVITGWDVPPLPSPPRSFWGEMRLSSQSLPAPKSCWGPSGRIDGWGGEGKGDKSWGGWGGGQRSGLTPPSSLHCSLLSLLRRHLAAPPTPDGSPRHRPGQAGRSAGSPSPGFRPTLLPATTLA